MRRRKFDTEGPVIAADHYFIPPLERMNLLHLHDLEYVRGLGLVARDESLHLANSIYAEVVPRELAWAAQAGLMRDAAWFVDAEGGLDVDKLFFQRDEQSAPEVGGGGSWLHGRRRFPFRELLPDQKVRSD